MTDLAPGTIVGGRFAIVGALGSGGTATVYLAVDQLRGERVALKVVHPHLAQDPVTRKRLRREVAAASAFAHEAALAPRELHELDGVLALSLPYHPGQTLAEHVAAAGPLPPDAVRELGVRIAEALAAAHRAGVLHRDVSANNVLVQGGRQAVLTDFGLARATAEGTRSTGVLGTAGFAAPETYAGARAEPRADLYGLGAVMYLAATGRAPFGTDAPMAVLQRQLADAPPPLRAARPELPPDLASTIEALLRKDPAARPQSARELADALAARRPLEAAPPALPAAAAPRVHLPPGRFAVVVRESTDDRARRQALRREQQGRVGREPPARRRQRRLEEKLAARATEIAQGVLAFVGIDPEDEKEPASPERLLVDAVAREGAVPAEALRVPLAVYDRRFVLARDVSEDAARHLASEARALGFRAETAEIQPQPPGRALRATLATALMVAGWVATPLAAEAGFVLPWIAFMVFFTLALPALAGARRARGPDLDGLPLAFGPDLTRALERPVPGRFALPDPAERALPEPSATEPPPAPGATRGQELLARARGQLDALERALADLDLPAPAASDLRGSAHELRSRAEDLATTVDRLDTELAAEAEDRSWVAPRLNRLETKQRAGEPVDPDELDRLRAALRAHEDAEAAAARLEAQLTTASAGLLEIAATAARVRRELLGQDPTSGASDSLERLRGQARALDDARRELGRRRAARDAG